MKRILQIVLVGIIFFLSSAVFSQNVAGVIKGIVKDNNHDPLSFATIKLSSTNYGTDTDIEGKFMLSKIPAGDYTLEISFIGYETQQLKIQVYAGKVTHLTVSMKEDSRELEAIEVYGKTETARIREQPYAVTAIDTKKLMNSTADLNQILNRTTGVRVREEGGLGSNFNFSLNGFSGKQVKFFLDGIPMDNFGSSLTLNNIPVNLAERIEVYKGVVPVHLGSDALGGAINIVTNQNVKNFLDASYSIGSFNTHRASVNSRITKKNGFMLNANVFYNYSDNSYKVRVQIADALTGKYGEPEDITRFHDQYKSGTIQLEAGVTNKKYADKLLIGLIASANRKEVQNGINMEQVAGQVFTTDRIFMPTLKYKKDNLFTKGLSLSVYGSYNSSKSVRVDSSSRIYDWHGNYTMKTINTSGEFSFDKTLFGFNDGVFLTTINASYIVNEHHSFSLNHAFNRFKRSGEDPLSRFPIPFEQPNILSKNIAGFSYKLDEFDNKFSAILFVKYFRMKGEVVDAAYGDYKPQKSGFNKPGYGMALSYFVLPKLQIKASFENTTRLPEGEEMFGNGLLTGSNPALVPESSKNMNAGLWYSKVMHKHRLDFETGLLYRLADDFIRYAGAGVSGTYKNVRDVRIKGIDGRVAYSYNSIWNVEVNATYQDAVNHSKDINYLYLDRLPNIPFLFGNAQAGIQLKNVLFPESTLSFNWFGLFVEEFYLSWPSQGTASSKYVIPRQFSQNVSVTSSQKQGRFNVSLECNNITNAELFDNFRQQKPGRSFSVKVRYFIKDNN